jgi:hypothetical protein
VVKNTDTGTVWMWENRIAGSASLERFPAAVCLKVKMEVEERAPVKLASSKRNVTANSSGAQAQVGTREAKGPARKNDDKRNGERHLRRYMYIRTNLVIQKLSRLLLSIWEAGQTDEA